MEFCRKESIPVDFVTRHHYTTELPEKDGHYGYAKLREPEEGFANLQTTRILLTALRNLREWNTYYRVQHFLYSNCPLHDTNRNAGLYCKTAVTSGRCERILFLLDLRRYF